MPSKITEGIVLRKYELRETSYILVVYTPDHGKIRGVIKGVRKPYPQFAGNFEVFTRCELVFYERKRASLDLITHCECLDFYLDARKDIERLTYANYIIELIDIVAGDADPHPKLYELLEGVLRLLASGVSPETLCRVFELKLLDAIGLAPEFVDCVNCGSEEKRTIRFSINDGGVVCQKCRHKVIRAMKVSKGTVNFMKKIQSLPLDSIHRIKLSGEVAKQSDEVLSRFISYHIGRIPKSKRFLDDIYTLDQRKGITTR